ncbi:MAG: tetratricopeptide repeat protein [Hyphomicrobiales bacterium]|nr:tetratricopeptide repeat protein [Hyphomicrobiales bacterium]
MTALGGGLAGCSKNNLSDITGSISSAVSQDRLPTSEPELRAYSEKMGQRYDSNRNDKRVAMNYARALRQLGQHTQAAAVMQELAARYPRDMEVLGAYGKTLAEAGRLQQAAAVLQNAHTPEHPNWSILSAQGSVADQLGDHRQAQNYYMTALRIRPNEPSVLSNLGLSYALSRNLPEAEQALRLAVAQPGADMRVRQNFALVLALEGKFTEAEEMSARDLSPMEATSNVAAIRRMIAQSNTWRDIKRYDEKAQAKTSAKRG